ncbi:3-oxoacyl-ACP synthase [Senegalia massiliensis]|uniref:3-oxoacyl-ACP synthase n=1 Tax=Senegalia massiliensis TaxID=1720316 RepID=A0A845QZ80_9CLOT|nr:3-oxoacyl-ACP synthase [Senegalia massiliensis]NBI07470.1 3-oxoacyl-ACP synthase [Senegalia massiliensis]
MQKPNVGIVGMGVYIPEVRMTAKDISDATGGIWAEEAIKEKLGIIEKTIPDIGDGTQEMGVKAGLDAIKNTGIDPLEIDLILCMGEEWKEYPLTTSGIYIQEKIGAKNAWSLDVQQRCCTTVAAMKIAKDMMLSDDNINTVMIVGGYRNGDLIDYADPKSSMMYNLAAGGGAIILKKNYNKNLLLGTHIMSDGSMSRDAGVEIGGTVNPIDESNLGEAYKSLKLMNPVHMKDRLNEVSMNNWFKCIDKAFEKSNVDKDELGYLAVLHFKRSMYELMLESLNLDKNNSIYLENYGHMGQVDQILSLYLGLKEGKIKDKTIVSMIAAGIGYAWAANVIRWG